MHVGYSDVGFTGQDTYSTKYSRGLTRLGHKIGDNKSKKLLVGRAGAERQVEETRLIAEGFPPLFHLRPSALPSANTENGVINVREPLSEIYLPYSGRVRPTLPTGTVGTTSIYIAQIPTKETTDSMSAPPVLAGIFYDGPYPKTMLLFSHTFSNAIVLP